jgi:hypothetical protein
MLGRILKRMAMPGLDLVIAENPLSLKNQGEIEPPIHRIVVNVNEEPLLDSNPGLQKIDPSIEDNYWDILPALACFRLQTEEEVV